MIRSIRIAGGALVAGAALTALLVALIPPPDPVLAQADLTTSKPDGYQIGAGSDDFTIQFIGGYSPVLIEVTAGDVPVSLSFNGEASTGKVVAATKTQPWPYCRGVNLLTVGREAAGTGAYVRWQ